MKIKFIDLTSLLALAITLSACSPSATPTMASMATEPPHTHDVNTSQDGNIDGSGIEGVQTYPDKPEYHDHVNSVPAPEGNLPPVFGAHYAIWQNCGIYDKSVDIGNAIHSMEHGAVWIAYRPDLSEEQVSALRNLARGHGFVLMTPYESLTDDVVLTAWGVQLEIPSFPDDRVKKFIAYYENGPQNPEPGAPCSGALGTPIE